MQPTGYGLIGDFVPYIRLLEAAGYDLKVVAHGHGRTLEDILAEQRASNEPAQ
ncbi:acetylglutamate kinase [Paraburkholderia sp. GAS42]|jgi:hypothetical protein